MQILGVVGISAHGPGVPGTAERRGAAIWSGSSRLARATGWSTDTAPTRELQSFHGAKGALPASPSRDADAPGSFRLWSSSAPRSATKCVLTWSDKDGVCMSFRGSMPVSFTIIVIVPMVAVALVLFKKQSGDGKADAQSPRDFATRSRSTATPGSGCPGARPGAGGRAAARRACGRPPGRLQYGRADAHHRAPPSPSSSNSSRGVPHRACGTPVGRAAKVAPLVALGGDASARSRCP